jgi:hypothetical protein
MAFSIRASAQPAGAAQDGVAARAHLKLISPSRVASFISESLLGVGAGFFSRRARVGDQAWGPVIVFVMSFLGCIKTFGYERSHGLVNH